MHGAAVMVQLGLVASGAGNLGAAAPSQEQRQPGAGGRSSTRHLPGDWDWLQLGYEPRVGTAEWGAWSTVAGLWGARQGTV